MVQHRRTRSIGWAIVLACLIATVVTPAAPAAAQDNLSLSIPLKEYENSGVSGTATLEATDGGTHVEMSLRGEPVTGNHPTHIHTGTCADFDPNPTYPLTTVILSDVSDAGVSETTVEDVRLRDLLDADYVILVHKSAEELTNYFVCGDIKADGRTGGGRNDAATNLEGTPDADQVSPSVNEAPRAGVGSAQIGLSWTTLFGLLAVLSAVASATLVRKRGARG
jgi:hypothetical protein